MRGGMNPTRDIIEQCCRMHNVALHDILGPSKYRPYVKARHHAMHRLYRELGLSMPRIARALRRKDHTTVLHGIRRYEEHWSKQ